MARRSLRYGILAGSYLLLTASRSPKPGSTEITLRGVGGQSESHELAGTTYVPGSGCGDSQSIRHTRAYREEQQAVALAASHTLAGGSSISAEVSALKQTRTADTLVPEPPSETTIKPAKARHGESVGGSLRYGYPLGKNIYGRLGATLAPFDGEITPFPSANLLFGAESPVFVELDLYGKSTIPADMPASASLGLSTDRYRIALVNGIGASQKTSEALIPYEFVPGTGLEGDVALGDHFRLGAGVNAYARGLAYDRYGAYGALTLVLAKQTKEERARKEAEKAAERDAVPWYKRPTESPFLNY